MTSTRQAYAVRSASDADEELVQSVNQVLYSIADRLDKIEGIRGEANIESDLDMNDQTVKNVNIEATDVTADTATIEDLAVNDITMTGDMFFTGTDSGLTYGEISLESGSTETEIVTQSVPVQIITFDTNGHSHNTTPDHTENHILVSRAGHYFVVVAATINSVAGSASKFEIMVKKNNGASTIIPHMDRNIAGGGGVSGVIAMSGFAELAIDDTVECWIENESNTANYIVEDISLSIIQIGGV